jgi:hypothetical protein
MFQIARVWHMVAGNVPVIWQTPLEKFNIKIWFVIRLRYGRNYTVIEWWDKTYNPQTVFSKILISNFTELYSAAGERKHVVEGQTDGPSWRPVTYQTNALCGKESAQNVMPSIATILLSRAHKHFQRGVKWRSVICSQRQMCFFSHYVQTLVNKLRVTTTFKAVKVFIL